MFSASRLPYDDARNDPREDVHDTAPSAGPAHTPRPTPPAASRSLQVHGPDDARRSEVEAFIRNVYREHHGATVRHFAPTLVSLSDETGALVAAAGYRFATQPLFLEHYLDAPVDAVLAPHTSAHPTREHIVEVGHLAAAQAGAGRRLILSLGHHLAGLNVQWVVSTLTQELRHLFVRMGVTPLALGVADPARLGAEAADWGTYYDHHPVVLAGQLELALKALARRGVVGVA